MLTMVTGWTAGRSRNNRTHKLHCGNITPACGQRKVRDRGRGRHPVAIVNDPQTGQALVSFLVSFVYVRNRSARITEDGQLRSQTLLNRSERIPTDLESVLGHPSRVESCIPHVIMQDGAALRDYSGRVARRTGRWR